MSINWHYFKKASPVVTTQKGRLRELAQYSKSATATDMKDWTSYREDIESVAKNGRSWRAEELRLKSHDDLHKLWYVLLKEKNKLKSDFLMAKQMGQVFIGKHDIKKVSLSMARLLTVVNERKRLRSQYRIFLEDEYIRKVKEREMNEFLANRDRMAAKGWRNLPMTPDEVKTLLKT